MGLLAYVPAASGCHPLRRRNQFKKGLAAQVFIEVNSDELILNPVTIRGERVLGQNEPKRAHQQSDNQYHTSRDRLPGSADTIPVLTHHKGIPEYCEVLQIDISNVVDSQRQLLSPCRRRSSL